MTEMALEYVFKILIYTVVVLVVIGIILNFQSIAKNIKFPCFYNCQTEKKCVSPTPIVNEDPITDTVLIKYYDLCSETTKGLKDDCLCFVIKGTFTNPTLCNNPNCVMECGTDATSVFVEYKFLDGKIYIEC